MKRALIALALIASHAFAIQVGLWIARPSAATAVAQLVAGDRPQLVAGIAGLVESAGDQWRRWRLSSTEKRLAQAEDDFRASTAALASCTADLGMSRHAVELALIAHESAIAALEIERKASAAAREALYVEDEDCRAWAAMPVCPGVLRLRDEERARDRAAGRGAATGGADRSDPAAFDLPQLRPQWWPGRMSASAGAGAAAMPGGSLSLEAGR